MEISEKIKLLRNEIPQNVKIIVVSKTIPVEIIKKAYDTGQRAFGENRVQELIAKQELMPKDTEWHLIGHLQTNKVKYIVPFVHLIHSVDSLKLLSEINREAAKVNRTIDCLLQIHIADEETKFGLRFEEVKQLLDSAEYLTFKNVRIAGLMGMATFTEDSNQVKREFQQLSQYFHDIKTRWFSQSPAFKELSMGMSGDYKVAIEAGSTMVRIGSIIFGERNYNR